MRAAVSSTSIGCRETDFSLLSWDEETDRGVVALLAASAAVATPLGEQDSGAVVATVAPPSAVPRTNRAAGRDEDNKLKPYNRGIPQATKQNTGINK